MPGILGRKTKIFLNDYPYKKDIQQRLFLSTLTVPEVKVLQEILNSSLKIPISELSSTLDIPESKLLPTLDKFSESGLLTRQNNAIFVDKELRKYFEFHIQKFDPDFQPTLDFLQGLLSKLPIGLLPTWYNISKTSDNIFHSLIEKYFLTPKVYEKYLQELIFGDEVLDGIVRDLFASENLELMADVVRNKYTLSREKFEEIILLLELHLAIFLSYREVKNKWVAVLTPLQEWRDFLQFQKNSIPKTIATKSIKRTHTEDFGYVLDLVKDLKKKSATIPQLGITPSEFLSLALQDQAMHLYRQAFLRFTKESVSPIESAERSFREVERSLRRVLDAGWVTFEDFMRGFISQIGTIESVSLKRQGRKWVFAIPGYPERERKFIEMMIFDLLYKAGITATGTYQGKPAFSITPYGRIALEE